MILDALNEANDSLESLGDLSSDISMGTCTLENIRSSLQVNEKSSQIQTKLWKKGSEAKDQFLNSKNYDGLEKMSEEMDDQFFDYVLLNPITFSNPP